MGSCEAARLAELVAPLASQRRILRRSRPRHRLASVQRCEQALRLPTSPPHFLTESALGGLLTRALRNKPDTGESFGLKLPWERPVYSRPRQKRAELLLERNNFAAELPIPRSGRTPMSLLRSSAPRRTRCYKQVAPTELRSQVLFSDAADLWVIAREQAAQIVRAAII
jgi:hypothetical protein